MVELDGIRANSPHPNEITVVFDTERGYMQVRCKRGKIKEFRDEKPLHSYPDADRRKMVIITLLVYEMLNGGEGASWSKYL